MSSISEEDYFISIYGGYNFFDGGDAEAQYVYRRLKNDGWIASTMPLEASRKARGEFNSESGVDTPENDKSSVRACNGF